MRITSLLLALSAALPVAAQTTTLPHIVLVPATADPAGNGNALLAAFNSFSSGVASTSQPYVVQLDAGVYTLPSAAVLPPYVSLAGSGMLSTLINGNLTMQNTANIDAKQSVANLTITAASGAPFIAQLGKFLLIDHVHLTGGTSVFVATTGNAHFLITDSLLGSVSITSSLPDGVVQTAVVNTIVATEMDPVSISLAAPAVVSCMATYNAAGSPLSASCQ